MSEQFETTWAAADRALLDVALAALPPTVAVSPVVTVQWAGTTSYAARLSTTKSPLGPPPVGIREELAPAAGVFMRGPTGEASVSIRALLRALTAAGFITRGEALAAAKTGDIPISLRAPLFARVDEDTQFEVELAWAAMYEADRSSPFWDFVVAAGIATAEQIDAVFALARTL
jgi:hypothetical protein